MNDNNLKQEKKGTSMKRKIIAIIVGSVILTTCVSCGTNTKSVGDISMEEKSVEVDNSDDGQFFTEQETDFHPYFYNLDSGYFDSDQEQDDDNSDYYDYGNYEDYGDDYGNYEDYDDDYGNYDDDYGNYEDYDDDYDDEDYDEDYDDEDYDEDYDDEDYEDYDEDDGYETNDLGGYILVAKEDYGDYNEYNYDIVSQKGKDYIISSNKDDKDDYRISITEGKDDFNGEKINIINKDSLVYLGNTKLQKAGITCNPEIDKQFFIGKDKGEDYGIRGDGTVISIGKINRKKGLCETGIKIDTGKGYSYIAKFKNNKPVGRGILITSTDANIYNFEKNEPEGYYDLIEKEWKDLNGNEYDIKKIDIVNLESTGVENYELLFPLKNGTDWISISTNQISKYINYANIFFPISLSETKSKTTDLLLVVTMEDEFQNYPASKIDSISYRYDIKEGVETQEYLHLWMNLSNDELSVNELKDGVCVEKQFTKMENEFKISKQTKKDNGSFEFDYINYIKFNRENDNW